jgi:hypothetical protein
MSKTVDLFIESDQPIEAVAALLAAETGWPVDPGETPGTWALKAPEQWAELHTHPYINDGALAFERYPYALTARVSGSRMTDSPQAAMLRTVADKLRPRRIATMLVHDLEYRESDLRPVPDAAAPESGAA